MFEAENGLWATDEEKDVMKMMIKRYREESKPSGV
jgi:hypothetical protein